MRFLIVKTSSLGDILQAIPCAQFIKSIYPNSILDWIIEEPMQDLISENPCVDNIIVVNTKKWRKHWRSSFNEVVKMRALLKKYPYDAVFDLQGNSKSAFFTKMARSQNKIGFGWKSVAEKPNWFVTNKRYDPPTGLNIRQDYLFLLEEYFQKKWEMRPTFTTIKQNNWMICSGSAWQSKQLSLQSWIQFLKKVEHFASPRLFFLSGNDKENEFAKALSQQFSHSVVLDRLPLLDLKKCMQEMKLVVSVDSLPLHLAAEENIPTFSIFGPSSSKKYKPLGDIHASFSGSCPFDKNFEKRCDLLRKCINAPCTKNIDIEELGKSFQRWLNDLYK